MYHLINNFTNTKGDALVGYYVKLKVSGGAYAPLFADVSSTPIVSVSGIADTAITDANGQFSIYVADGDYDIEFFDAADVNQRVRTISSVPMYGSTLSGDAILAAESSTAADAVSTAADRLQTGLDRVATAADAAATAADRVQTGADVASTTALKDAADVAVATLGAYSDTTLAAALVTGLAAVTEGQTFRATGDDVNYVGYYTDLSGVATETISLRVAKPSYLDGILPISAAAAYFPSPRFPILVGGTANIQYASGYWERTTSTGTGILEYYLTVEEKALGGFDVVIPFTGTFSDTPDIQMFNGGSGIGSRVDGVVEGANYVVPVTTTGTPDRFRFRWSTTGTGKVGNPYIRKTASALVDPTTAAGADVVKAWHKEIVEATGNHMRLSPAFTWVVGAGATLAGDGKTIIAPSGSIQYFNIYTMGLFDPGESYTIVGRQKTGTLLRDLISTQPQAYNGGSGGAAGLAKAILPNGYFAIQGVADASGGIEASRIAFNIDTRANGVIAATAANVEALMLLRGAWTFDKIMADVPGLLKEFEQQSQLEAFVSSTTTGTRVFSTLKAALRSGSSNITCNETSRLSYGFAVNNDVEITMKDGAGIRGSTQYTLADFAATAADANVYYRASTYNPIATFEITTATGTVRKNAIEVAAPTIGLSVFASSEVDVRNNAGAFWYGAGSEGTGWYIRPWGDTWTGKTLEVPSQYCNNLFRVGAGVKLTVNQDANALSGFSYAQWIYNEDGYSHWNGGTLGWNSTNDGVKPAFSAVTEFSNGLCTGGSNDGYNSNPTANQRPRLIMNSFAFDANISDGISMHGVGTTDIIMTGRCSVSDNGKQGCPPIGPTNLTADHLVARNNRDVDLLWNYASATVVSVKIGFLDAVTASFANTTSASNITGRINGRWTTLTKTNATIDAFLITGTAS